jgi:hypothetical protein
MTTPVEMRRGECRRGGAHGDGRDRRRSGRGVSRRVIGLAEAVVAGEEFCDMVTNMYRHLVPGSVTAATYRDV